MDDNSGLNILRNWGYYEPSSIKGHLGLQLKPTVADRDTKSIISGRESPFMVNVNGAFHHRDCGVPETPVSMDFVRDDGWMNQREKYLHPLPGNPNFALISEASGAYPIQMLQPPEAPKDERLAHSGEVAGKKEGSLKKGEGGRTQNTQKCPKPKKSKKVSGVPKDEFNSSTPRPRVKTGKNTELVINGVDMDISGIPIPVCSCTGVPQQCYRWGCGGWQSACCTTNVSMYPLPMSTKRRGARIAGRKMSQGAFKKVLEKLSSEGFNLSNPIDLRTHWAKHGTNKFVTIR